MAILATAMGFAAAFALSFPATHTFVGNRGDRLRHPPPAGGDADHPAGRAGVHPGLAVRHRPAGRHPRHRASTPPARWANCSVELNENADLRPVDGIRSVGGSWLAQIRYGVVPQVLPGFLSYALLRFEINVRSSTIIGFVGAGGIGQELKRVIGFNIYEEVSAIVILILLIVVAIDLASEQIRHRFIGALARGSRMSDSDHRHRRRTGCATPRRSARKGWLRWLLLAAIFAYLFYLMWLFDFGRVFTGLPKVWVIVRLMLDWTGFAEWDHAELWRSMLETVAMAYLGTMLAVVFAMPLGFLGARNVIPQRVFRFFTRRLFDGLRGLDQLIWALVFVRAMGLGPIAGILAIAVAETGVLAKLFAEAMENIDRRQVEGITSVGAGFVAALRFAVLPQVLPVMISQALY